MRIKKEKKTNYKHFKEMHNYNSEIVNSDCSNIRESEDINSSKSLSDTISGIDSTVNNKTYIDRIIKMKNIFN
jgi:hypothetical protein